jgi:hypothetical protein
MWWSIYLKEHPGKSSEVAALLLFGMWGLADWGRALL